MLFSSIQNHDNKEQARIYPRKLKDIVPGRQSGIIAGLNKCKILTGTNASNGSRTWGYISPFVLLLWLACICVPSRPTTQDDREARPLSCPAGHCHQARSKTVSCRLWELWPALHLSEVSNFIFPSFFFKFAYKTNSLLRLDRLHAMHFMRFFHSNHNCLSKETFFVVYVIIWPNKTVPAWWLIW